MPAVGVSTPLIRDAPSAEPKVRVVPVVISCAVCAISDLNFSMLVPFFPEAAERHGCTPTVTGMLFGLHQVVALLVTPARASSCASFARGAPARSRSRYDVIFATSKSHKISWAGGQPSAVCGARLICSACI